MMVKKQKTAPPATEKSEPVESEVIESPKPQPKPKLPINIPQELIEQAKMFGIDLGQIVNWVKEMEEFKQVTIANFEIIQKSFDKLEPLLQLSEKVQQAQNQPMTAASNPQPGGFNLGALLQFLPQLLGGGGGDSELASLGNQYGKLVLKQAIENVGKPSIEEKIGEAVLEGFIRKKSGEAAKVLTES